MNIENADIGYLFSGFAFAALFARVLVDRPSLVHSGWLKLALAGSIVWATLIALDDSLLELSAYQLFLIEIIHDGFWLLFLARLLGGAVGYEGFWLVRFGGLLLVFLVLLIGSLTLFVPTIGSFNLDIDRARMFGSLFTALLALVGLEQIYRNARPSERKGLKYLVLGLGAIFVLDMILYSNAILSGHISELLWSTRGMVILACVPLIGIAVSGGPAWLGGVFVSRHVVFYTTTFFFAVIYLVIIAFSGFLIRAYGGEWGATGQLIFFAVAVLILTVALLSDQGRAKLRVYIAKHFFESKYDYRAEWLRLIETLTASDDTLPLRKRAIKSLAQVLDAHTGLLWLRSNQSEDYACVSSWNEPCIEQTIPAGHSLVDFLRRTGWIIDLRELNGNRKHYETLVIGDCFPGLKGNSIIVPLIHDREILGFVFLGGASSQLTLNFEDYDLLKTAGKQIASYLAQEISTEQLAESRQFEAFNRLTAYLMHDLKNLIAQQSLVVENAEKHKGNPQFVDDAIETISGGVHRLRRVLDQIQQRKTSQVQQRIELGQLIEEVVAQCSDREPIPGSKRIDDRVWVKGDRDRMLMAIHHTVRNSQDATEPDGEVSIELIAEDSICYVIVRDSGIGMDEAFVNDRLFRPFDSTKGTQGMGIGAYQMRETVRNMGGDVSVQSKPGTGTVVRMRLSRVE